MDFALLPPEVNSTRMYTGPGAAPMLAAAAAWDALAADLEAAAVGCSEVISTLTGDDWSGPAAAAMTNAAAPYVAWLQAGAAKAEQTAAQAKTAAAAFEAAFAATVPPAVVAANRALLATLIATNFFGQNLPAIAATEAHYGEMWAQDAVAMYSYAAAAAPASALPALDQPPRTTNPAGLAGQSAAVSHAAADGGQTLSQFSTAIQAALQQLVTPVGSSNAAPAAGPVSLAALVNPVTPFTSVGASSLSACSSMYTVVSNGAGWGRLLFVRGGVEGALTFEGLGARGVLTAVTTPSASVGLGTATPIGGLSVPPSWVSAAPEIRSVAVTLASAESALPVAAGLPPGAVFQEAMMGTTAGRGSMPDATGRRERKTGEKSTDQDGQPAVTLTNGNGWLASTWAYHNRRRDAPPIPSHWRTG